MHVHGGWLCGRHRVSGAFPVASSCRLTQHPPFPPERNGEEQRPSEGNLHTPTALGALQDSPGSLAQTSTAQLQTLSRGGSPRGIHLQGFWAPAMAHRPRTRTAARSRVSAMSQLSCTPGQPAKCRLPTASGGFIIFPLFALQAEITFRLLALAPTL